MEFRNSTQTSADLYFYGDIVSDWWGKWQEEDQYPEAIKNFLTEQTGKSLNIYINSGGGSVFAGIAIYNMLKRHGQSNQVQVHVDGLAGSIASVIAFSGTQKPKIPSNAYLMIHNPWTWGEGNAKELRKMADDLDQITVGILNIYKDNLKEGVSIETIQELMEAETWLNGEQAADYFNIEVGESQEYVAAVGGYVKRAKNIPQSMKKNKDNLAKQDERAKNQKIDDMKRLVIKSYERGIRE